MGAESFTVMAILDAQDRASALIDRVSKTVERFSKVMSDAAATAETAGTAIDESLLQTASGENALALANDRVAGSEAKLTLATEAQATAERELMAARSAGLGNAELAAASDKLAAADRDAAKASAELKTAQEGQILVAQTLSGATDDLAASEETAAAASTGWVGIIAAASVALAAAGAVSLKSAGDFQSSTTHLVTDAGEQASALGMVSDAMLKIAVDTGTSTDKLSQGMYHLESAGFHGAEGIVALNVAAQGAKVGNADLDTVSKTLAGTLDSYRDQGYSAAQMMNMLIETTARGDVRMQDLATSLGNVTPIAAAAGIQFEQVGGAVATMTSQNMTAAQASQNLAHLIGSLAKPNAVQIEQMRQLGIDSNDLSQNLGKRGLTGTLDILVEAIARHTRNGQVFIDSLHNSEAAAADATRMLSLMSPEVKKLAEQLQDGQIGVKDYTKAISGLGPEQFKSGKEFLTLNEKMGSFNKLLSSGSPEAETMNAALSNLTGGQVGLRTALMLSTDKGAYFKEATEKIGDAAHDTSGKVKNWDTIQKTFNQKVDELKSSFEVLGIQIGTKIMPYIEKLMGIFAKGADFLMKNKTVVEGLAIALGVNLAAALIVLSALAIGVVLVVAAIGIAFMLLWKAAQFLWKYLVIAWDGIVASAKDLWHGMKSTWDSIVSGFSDAWDWIKNTTKSVWDGILGFFDKWWPLLLLVFATPIAVLMGIWNRFHKFITDTASSVWDGIVKFFSYIWESIVKDATRYWNIIRDSIVKPLEKAASAVGDQLSSIWDSITKTFSDVMHWLSGVLDGFENFGEDIVRGIVRGVKHNAGELFDELEHLGESALKFAKDVIGVKSPSRRFADEVGKWIPHGIAAGINEHAPIAHAAVRKLAGSLTGAAKLDAGFGVPAFGSQAGIGGGGSTIVFDMRGTQLMSDRDMDVFADRVGRRIATRVLPAGGVRIRM